MLSKPEKPQRGREGDPAEYKINMADFKYELSEWRRQHESFTKLIDYIHASVTPAVHTYIEKVENHP